MVHPDTGTYNNMVMPGGSTYPNYPTNYPGHHYYYYTPTKIVYNKQKSKPKLSKVDSVYLLKPELRQSYFKLPIEFRPTAPILENN